MARQQAPLSPVTNEVETQPALYLVAETGVDRSGGYIGVLLRYTKMQYADDTRRRELRESHFLMSSSEASELRDLLDQALDGMRGGAYH